ncbi:MAG: DUF2341 domain-containing protein [Chitinispirillaceae bacterium]|nr:DUF2341 domain-containing protein [Chitinispirillaceae bacterium]
MKRNALPIRNGYAAFLIALAAISATADDDYADWPCSSSIYLNTSATGADVSGNVTGFPLLIRLTKKNFDFFPQTLPGGADIRFAKTDGTHLSYAIERWKDHSNNNDTAHIWVLIDTVFGTTPLQEIVMLWGNGNAKDSSNSGIVFNRANGFLGIYHLSGNVNDASSNGNNAVYDTSVDTASGIIGRARAFDGSSHFFQPGDIEDRPSGSISCWFRPRNTFNSSTETTQGIYGKCTGENLNVTLSLKGNDFSGGADGITGELQTKIENETGGTYLSNTTGTYLAGVWYYVTWTWGNNTSAIYLNGRAEASINTSHTLTGDDNDEIGRSYYDGQNIQEGGPRYFHGTIDEFRLENSVRSAHWIKLCYENQRTAQTLVVYPLTYTWDTDNSAGIQPDDGTWGDDDFWTTDGTTLVAWAGIGNRATFAGSDGTYTITVNGTQNVDSIYFGNSGYTLSGGTVNLGKKSGITLASGKTASISAVIAGTGGLHVTGVGTSLSTLTLSGANTYTGVTTLGAYLRCNVSTLANGGSNSAIGAASSSASNLVLDGGQLRYTGSGASTDRLFTLGTTSSFVYSSGNGAMNFSNTGSISFSGSGDRSIEFGGDYRGGANTFSPEIGDGSGGATSVVTSGADNTWLFTADHTYTGTTDLLNGTLIVNGSIASESRVTVYAAATLAGNGACLGPVAVSGTLSPGYSGAGKLNTGALDVESVANSIFELGAHSDTVAVSGDLVLDGSLTVVPISGFTSGPYLLFTYSGDLTNDTLEIVSAPEGLDYSIVAGDGTVTLVASTALIKQEPKDTAVIEGEDAVFSVVASGEGTLSYQWINGSSEIVGSGTDLSLTSVTVADTGGYRCIVTDDYGSDTSRRAYLTILFPPAINDQSPNEDSVLEGTSARLWVDAGGSDTLIYQWYNVRPEADSLIDGASSDSLIIAATEFADSGFYYCVVSNRAGEAISDTVHLVVMHHPPVAGFTFSPQSGLTPLDVGFADSSTGAITSRLWLFGDGSSSTELNPTHVYSTSGLYTVTLAVAGPGGADTLVKSDSVFAFEEGRNPVRITARFLSGTDVEIMLQNIDKIDTLPPFPVCDSVGIWVKPQSVPESAEDGTLLITYPRSVFTGEQLIDTLSLPDTDTLFGLMSACFWNYGMDASFYKANGTTVVLCEITAVENTIDIDTLFFDSAAGVIRIRWCMDSLQALKDPAVGITYGFDRFPPTATTIQPVTILRECTDTTVLLREPLLFDTLYYISLWLRMGEASWLEPTEDSRDTVRVGSPYRQIITFFDTTSVRDTVTAFNGSVILWKDSAFSENVLTTDTLEVMTIDTVPVGMIVVGTPFFFRKAEPILPFYIGIRIDSVPTGYFIDDVRIYRDSAGIITVHHETVVDTEHDMVYIKTGDLSLPSIAMIDTAPTEITVHGDTAAFIISTETHTDSIRIADNVANVRWKFYYGRGDQIPPLRQQEELNTGGSSIFLTIPDTLQVISSETGLRACVIISDGVHVDTINLSRSVLRRNSDQTTTEGMEWNPVYATGELKNKDVQALVTQVADEEDNKYDRRYVRLYRWISYEENASDNVKWVEFDPDNTTVRSHFSLEPGRLLWLKTRSNKPFDLDTAYTLSLKDTFTVVLPEEQWTDFGMPYRFSVSIDDILSASGGNADSLYIYKWKRDSATGIFSSEPYFVPVLSGKDDRSLTLDYMPKGGYSLYNPYPEAVALRIPPTLPGMSKMRSLVKQRGKALWSFIIAATIDNGMRMPPVYCGYAPGITKMGHPVAPSFSKVRACVFNRTSGERFGHYIGEEAKNGLVTEVRVQNESDSGRTVSFHIEKAGAVPESYHAVCYDPQTGNAGSIGSITLPPRSFGSRWLIAGDPSFHHRFFTSILPLTYSLHPVYPNPSRAVVNIRYSVPFGVQERIAVSIFNAFGEMVWKKRINDLLCEGTHHLPWNGVDMHGNPIGSGIYIVRLQIIDSSGKSLRQFNRKCTYFR